MTDKTKKTKTIAAGDMFKTWRKDPEYRKAYAEAESEFLIAAAMIAARSQAHLTQAELAERMGTTQSAIARMESGKFKPSHGTLEKIARATGTRLRVSFEPTEAQR
ncbi:helix-turn-helix transcriptional regulator [Sphingobium sp. AN641]|uniref:helix-turn-helix domain-containing protein n=1 Tax=Sphingobium sp. AN641 TaxID=3133443 RepID=UPI0030BE4450